MVPNSTLLDRTSFTELKKKSLGHFETSSWALHKTTISTHYSGFIPSVRTDEYFPAPPCTTTTVFDFVHAMAQESFFSGFVIYPVVWKVCLSPAFLQFCCRQEAKGWLLPHTKNSAFLLPISAVVNFIHACDCLFHPHMCHIYAWVHSSNAKDHHRPKFSEGIIGGFVPMEFVWNSFSWLCVEVWQRYSLQIHVLVREIHP